MYVATTGFGRQSRLRITSSIPAAVCLHHATPLETSRPLSLSYHPFTFVSYLIRSGTVDYPYNHVVSCSVQ